MSVKKFALLPLLFACITAHAVELGEKLSPLSFETKPRNFHYEANGKVQLITIYPAKPSSTKNGKFNYLMQEEGICPLSITDINNKSWFAPVSMVESKMEESLTDDKNILGCQVSGDYTGQAVKQWQLKKEAVTIVVNGEGTVIFLEYGVLNKQQEQQVISLLN